MQKIYKITTELISSAIKGTDANIQSENIDFKSLFDICESLDISPLIGYSLHKNNLLTDDEYKTHFKNTQMIALYRYMQSENEFTSVCTAFDRENIDYLPLKGAVISKYYPEEYLRTKSDIDILVRAEDIKKASDILCEELQYEKGEVNDHDISFFSKSGYHIELHFSLMENDEKTDNLLSRVWDDTHTKDDRPHYHYMNNEFFIFYHIVHMAKHFIHGGCGVKPVVDLWIIKNKMGYDEEKLSGMLLQSSIKKFYDEISHLCDVWFENAPHSDLSEKIENFLFQSGVYGTMENNIAISRYKKGGGKNYLLSKAFLSYKDMAIYYPSLKKFPPLYPLYQIRRWFKIAFCGGAAIAKEQIKINKNMTDDKQNQVSFLLDKLEL